MQKRFKCLFASIWTSITGPIFLSNFSSDFPDFPLKNEYPENPFFATFFDEKWPIWARSSAGRALRSHRRGRGFDPLRVHHFKKNHRQIGGDFSFDHDEAPDNNKGTCLDRKSKCPLSKSSWFYNKPGPSFITPNHP